MIKMLKRFLALAFMTCALTSAFSEGADIVVLMDASGTILPWFDEINSRVLVDITKKFIRQGDTFHLISFNSRVNLEIVQPIESEADVSRVVSRFMLLYPLGQNSDFLSGLHYTWQYVSSLEQSRQKVVIIISDGIFNPPADSAYASYTPDQVKTDIAQISRQIRGAGWNVYYVKLPFPENAEISSLDGKIVSSPEAASKAGKNGKGSASQKKDSGSKGKAEATTQSETKKYIEVSSDFESSLDISQSELPKENVPLTFVDSLFSMPEVTFPDNIGKKGRVFMLPLKVKNVSDKTVNMELTGVYWNDMDVLGKTSFLNLSPKERGTLRAEIRLPETVGKGPFDLPIRLQFSGNTRVNPQAGTVHLTVVGFSPEMLFMSGVPFVFSVILIVLALIFVILLILFVIRKTARPVPDAVNAAATAEAVVGRSAQPAKAEKQAAGYASSPRKQGMAFAQAASGNAQASGYSPDTDTSRNAAAILSSAAKPEKTGLTSLAEVGVAKEVDRKSILASMVRKEDKQIHFEVARDDSADKNVAQMASALAAEKSARLSVLADAAKKYTTHEVVRTGASATEPIQVKESGNIMLELSVGNQNPHIGKRNVHMMKAGTRLSIGGGTSAFLIFLVRFPAHIAEIRFDGKQCNLAILKPQYFPYETDNVISDCVGREFTVVSDKGYEVAFRLAVYEDPVLKLNRLMKSIM
jgi:hypothetical protein